ncbi:MAG: hypothetical protein WCS77_00835, partial [Elusimicrobiaceae bacterium]
MTRTAAGGGSSYSNGSTEVSLNNTRITPSVIISTTAGLTEIYDGIFTGLGDGRMVQVSLVPGFIQRTNGGWIMGIKTNEAAGLLFSKAILPSSLPGSLNVYHVRDPRAVDQRVPYSSTFTYVSSGTAGVADLFSSSGTWG